jgi:hypothetical protein
MSGCSAADSDDDPCELKLEASVPLRYTKAIGNVFADLVTMSYVSREEEQPTALSIYNVMSIARRAFFLHCCVDSHFPHNLSRPQTFVFLVTSSPR